jgi:hypothetical protein
MTVIDLQRRIIRLEELSRGLSLEDVLWRQAQDPLLYLERRAYLDAIRDALAGVESARVLLAKACLRIREESERNRAS